MARLHTRFIVLAAVLILVYLTLKIINPPDENLLEEFHTGHHKQAKEQETNFLAKPKSERQGLTAIGNHFKLDGVPITLISGAIHYFRMPMEYWRDRLVKAKQCGLNAVETYVPWNLHEPKPGKFDFHGVLNLKKFILLAQEVGLLVIIRPGPYICSEWEFGGLPSWLLSDESMKVRTMHGGYIKAVKRYFNQLLPIIVDLQYKQGGPIIAFQLDNEYGSYFKDSDYLPFLKDLVIKSGISELLFVSDSIEGLKKQTIPGVLKTANFKSVDNHLFQLKSMQPDKPQMVMEFWVGWFDWWGEKHHQRDVADFESNLVKIFKYGASVNLYMFFGGTNFGFMNGGFYGGVHQADITSYDYDALLSENGDITPKYLAAQRVISKFFPNKSINSSAVQNSKTSVYPPLSVKGQISIWDTIKFLTPPCITSKTVPMEMLTNVGCQQQSYGYILYRAEITIEKGTSVTVKGFDGMNDRGMYFLNRHKQTTLTHLNKKQTFKNTLPHTSTKVNLDVLVENAGRTNWEVFDNQRKGLSSDLIVNGEEVTKWSIYSFEMKPDFINQLDSWSDVRLDSKLPEPAFFQSTLFIESKQELKDTFLDMSKWGKGVVFVNGVNIGRYWSIGPQQTLYLPAPFLKVGINFIVIFEEVKQSTAVVFSSEPILG